MHVPSIFRSSFSLVSPIHRWPQPLKRAMLTVATLICAIIYTMLIVGVFSVMAIFLDLLKVGF